MEIIETIFDVRTNTETQVKKEYIQPQEELLVKELSNLVEWFVEYDNQVKQYERCQRLGIEFDKDINELDAQATINQKRIAEIRSLLK